MTQLPERPADSGGAQNLPARRLSTVEVEAVIRRAVELQAREADTSLAATEGMTEAELIRIGEELGVSARHMQRALAETPAAGRAEDGWFGRGFGPSDVVATRFIARSVEPVRAELDTYLREREFMVVQRRFADRFIYGKASGFTADLGRFASDFSQRYPRLDVPELEVGLRPADERSCYVSLRITMQTKRTGMAVGGLLTGGSAGGATALFLGIAVAPPAALVGLPIFAGSIWAMRAAYRHGRQKKQEQLESLLDRLEHGELLAISRPTWRERLGL